MTQASRPTFKSRFVAFYADAWLRFFFWNARVLPAWTLRSRAIFLWGAWQTSGYLREVTLTNAARLKPNVTTAEQKQLAKRILESFYLFVYDVGRNQHKTASELAGYVESEEGMEHYQSARALGRGAIIVTAHLGSFEVGLASLRAREAHVHVVFQRDERSGFETIRRRLRDRLGIHEAPLEEGAEMWGRLREALRRDEVVVMQADRALRGQRSATVPFMGGHIQIPTGPYRLALASGAPIIPLYAVRLESGKVRMMIDPPIVLGEDGLSVAVDENHPAVLAFARSLEAKVKQWPEQWLVLYRAWVEDQS